jgi:serine/threonine protein kinase
MCEWCGADLLAGAAPERVCPACLLRLALEPADDGDADPQPEPVRLLGPVGQGPNGTVYLGYREQGEPRLVTVKLITAGINVDRFMGSIHTLSGRLRSHVDSRIPSFLDCGLTRGGQAYVLATYIAGCPIGRYITHTLGSHVRFRLAIRLCQLVSHLHDAGIVHGSIKPTNVIVSASPDGPVALLLDVGIVPAIEASRVTPRHDVVFDAHHDLRSLEKLIPSLLEGVSVIGSHAFSRKFETAAQLAEELADLSQTS